MALQQVSRNTGHHPWSQKAFILIAPSASLTGSPDRSPTRSRCSADLGLEDEPLKDTDLSDDEGAPPDVPALTGLFPQGLFKSLLHKAKVISGLVDPATTTSASTSTGHGIFSEPVVEQLFIPAPKLFTDVVHKQWFNPASLPSSWSLPYNIY